MATPTRQWVCIAILALLGSTLTLAHVVKPPSADLDHVVKPPRADLDHVVKPSKADPAHVVKPPKPDPAHVVKPLKADPTHVVKPPKVTRSRKLQIDKKGETKTTNFWASDSDPSRCDGGGQAQVTNPGYASGSQCSFGFHNIFPFHAFPFGSGMPEVSMWGDGGGYGGSNTNQAVDSSPSGN